MADKSYSQLILLPTFIERFRYLKIDGKVGEETFGCDRYLNQALYNSGEWRAFRNRIIVRDSGCDLAAAGFDIFGSIIVHHINPITIKDIKERSPRVFDPENVVCTTDMTHKAIHYSDENLLPSSPVQRSKNDTCPWRH